MAKQRVIFYYDDEYDHKIHEFLESVPSKRKGEAIRSALLRAIERVTLSADPLPAQEPVDLHSSFLEASSLLTFEPED